MNAQPTVTTAALMPHAITSMVVTTVHAMENSTGMERHVLVSLLGKLERQTLLLRNLKYFHRTAAI